VHYIHGAVTQPELVALFRAADVMLVTPLRDGMNLVAKEFVASRVDEAGVLVLSEFAGAAAELDGALTVNPYDVDAVAASMRRALSMSAEESRARMHRLRRRVFDYDVHVWARTFLERLEAVCSTEPAPLRPEPALQTVLAKSHRTRHVRLLLDYDGTLVPIAPSPELAPPDPEALSLLAALAAADDVSVEIVSGRPRETLERWFGELPLALSAEHGFWHRPAPGAPWTPAAIVSPESLTAVESILDQFAARTPGAHVEKKGASLAWHYRRADREFGARQAHELRMLLGDALSNQPFEVVEGKKVIEVRLRGVSKALAARRAVSECDPGMVIVALGDDRTDEDLFGALPLSSITIAVGARPAGARFRLADYRAARRVLRLLTEPNDATGLVECDWATDVALA
jgi:trehalose 6-phosphate synthase/phosphatase